MGSDLEEIKILILKRKGNEEKMVFGERKGDTEDNGEGKR